MKNMLVGCYCTKGAIKAFEMQGFTLFRSKKDLLNLSMDEIDNIVKCEKEKRDIQYCFTFGFSPNVASVCYSYDIKYICWVWDCPHSSLWAKEARWSTTMIFVFDYSLYLKQIERGMTNVFYLPLAGDAEMFSEVIEKDQEKNKEKYYSDVCFLGNFYNDGKHDLFDKISYIPSYAEGYINGLISAQRKIWGADLLENTISDSVWEMLRQSIKMDVNNRYEEGYYEANIQNMIGQKIAQLERMEMCSELNKRFDFVVYTDCDTSFDKSIINKGHADYFTEMPLIFHYSKINIHMTIRSIPTGVPLRVMDVLASGGFLLTNYQKEIAEYFEDGKELVIYNDLFDLFDKIQYYLEHEEERTAIAQAGYLKVTKDFSYRNQISQMNEVIKTYEKDCNYI